MKVLIVEPGKYPHETDNPEEFITEVCYPVRQA